MRATAFFKPHRGHRHGARRIGGGSIELDDNHQRVVDMGRTVVFEVGPVTLLISELRGLAGNVPGVYRAFGIEPTRLQDRGSQDRVEFPVFRAAHLAGDPRRYARTRPIGRFHAAVATASRVRSIRSIRSTDWREATRADAAVPAEKKNVA